MTPPRTPGRWTRATWARAVASLLFAGTGLALLALVAWPEGWEYVGDAAVRRWREQDQGYYVAVLVNGHEPYLGESASRSEGVSTARDRVADLIGCATNEVDVVLHMPYILYGPEIEFRRRDSGLRPLLGDQAVNWLEERLGW